MWKEGNYVLTMRAISTCIILASPNQSVPCLLLFLILIVIQFVYHMCMLNDAKQPNLAQKAIVGV